MNIFCYFCIYFDELVAGYSCGVDLPVAPPNTELTILTEGSIVIQYRCVSLKQGISEQHCPVSNCGENDIWSPFNISCRGKFFISHNSILL
jgi:hypothetical protein